MTSEVSGGKDAWGIIGGKPAVKTEGLQILEKRGWG
jgi:hypothetical protein